MKGWWDKLKGLSGYHFFSSEKQSVTYNLYCCFRIWLKTQSRLVRPSRCANPRVIQMQQCAILLQIDRPPLFCRC